MIRTVCPGRILALPTSMCHDVSNVIEAAAASSKLTPSGIFATLTSGKCVISENAPHVGPVWNPQMVLFVQSYSRPSVHASHTLRDMFECETTLSPTLKFVTSSPTAITSPAASEPETCGNGTATGCPLIPQISLELRAAALTRKTTSFGFGFGSGISFTLR